MVTIYNDGSLYGDTDAILGRVGAALLIAQSQESRQTALEVIVRDEKLNAWELFAGTRSNEELGVGFGIYKPINPEVKSFDLNCYAYRGGTSMFKLENGTIIRTRIGNPATPSDRQLWIQTITDPTNPSQWTSWSVLYSGTHYSATVFEVSSSTYTVIHAKADGLYVDNVKVVDNSEVGDGEKILSYTPVENSYWYVGWLLTISEDPIDHRRTMQYYYTTELGSSSPIYDATLNYRNYHLMFRPINTGDKTEDPPIIIDRVVSSTLEFDSRVSVHGMALWYDQYPGDYAPYPIRGIGGGSGSNWMNLSSVVKLSDGFYYAFASEGHSDQDFEGTTSLGVYLPVWARSKDLKHWTDWTVGPPVKNSWGAASRVVEAGGYLYWAENELVYRRPMTVVDYDITNYVPKLEFELPRDNQPASGIVTVANPVGIHDALKTLSDRELIIRAGLKLADGTYELASFDKFFIEQITTELEGKTNRLSIKFGNVWNRLNNTLRDITNFVGKTYWDDFDAGCINQPFNYYFLGAGNPTVNSSSYRLSARGLVLFTGWKGQNPDVQVHFTNVSGTLIPQVILRYVDSKNYLFLEAGNTFRLVEVWKGNQYEIDSWSVPNDASPKVRIQLRWNTYIIWLNDEIQGSGYLPGGFHNTKPGYVGFNATAYEIGKFHLEDWQSDISMGDLVRAALALGDFHDVIVGGCDDRAYAITWGPQTDLSTPAAALAQALETTKTQLIYRNGFVEVGRFNDQTPVKTIENEITSADQIDEAKRRINLASVDGNSHFWIEVDAADITTRGRLIVGYYDLPELLDLEAVKARAREEIRRSGLGSSPGGTTPLFFDLHRMDAVTWIDAAGDSKVVRIEGFAVSINQSTEPSQKQTFDLSDYSEGSSDFLMDSSEAIE